MHITGILIHSRPHASDRVAELLRQFPGLEIHSQTADNRFIVTIEGNEQLIADTMSQVDRLDGVLAASLVYHYGEPESTDA